MRGARNDPRGGTVIVATHYGRCGPMGSRSRRARPSGHARTPPRELSHPERSTPEVRHDRGAPKRDGGPGSAGPLEWPQAVERNWIFTAPKPGSKVVRAPPGAGPAGLQAWMPKGVSGTDQVAGLSGTMMIKIADGRHPFEFSYTISDACR